MSCSFSPLDQWPIEIRGPYKIVIADSRCRRAQGLQKTKSLPENTLVLFPNALSGSYFHTKNCLFAMDIVPLSNSGEILNIFTVNPGTIRVGPMPFSTSKVLEAPANWFREKGFRKGDFVPLFNI